MNESSENPAIDEKPSSDFLHEYLQKTDLSTTTSLNQFVKDHQITREENETEEAFTKRVKKINYLNLAQQLIRNSAQHNHSRQITKPEVKSSTHVRSTSLLLDIRYNVNRFLFA